MKKLMFQVSFVAIVFAVLTWLYYFFAPIVRTRAAIRASVNFKQLQSDYLAHPSTHSLLMDFYYK